MLNIERRRFSLGAMTATLVAGVPAMASAQAPGPVIEGRTMTAEDRLEIHELYARYAWALGTGDTEVFVACFTADGMLCEDVFEDVDRWVGADSLRAMLESFLEKPGFAGRQHHATQFVIEGNPAQANVKSFCLVTFCDAEPPFPTQFAGYYNDVVVKQNGRWLFKERVIRDWSGPILKAFAGQSGEKVPRKRPLD